MPFEELQGLDSTTNLGNLCHWVSGHPHSKGMFPDVQVEPSVFQLVSITPCSVRICLLTCLILFSQLHASLAEPCSLSFSSWGGSGTHVMVIGGCD